MENLCIVHLHLERSGSIIRIWMSPAIQPRIPCSYWVLVADKHLRHFSAFSRANLTFCEFALCNRKWNFMVDLNAETLYLIFANMEDLKPIRTITASCIAKVPLVNEAEIWASHTNCIIPTSRFKIIGKTHYATQLEFGFIWNDPRNIQK